VNAREGAGRDSPPGASRPESATDSAAAADLALSTAEPDRLDGPDLARPPAQGDSAGALMSPAGRGEGTLAPRPDSRTP